MRPEDKIGVEVLLSISGALFALFFLIRWREGAARKWPRASGTIITSTTVRKYAGYGREEVLPVIEYEFDYQGQSYRSSHWRFGNYSEGNSASADPVVARYRVGSAVTVYVNQRHPTKSVLEIGTSSLSWIPFGFGLFTLVLAVVAIVAALR
jgi:hypothetical protein